MKESCFLCFPAQESISFPDFPECCFCLPPWREGAVGWCEGERELKKKRLGISTGYFLSFMNIPGNVSMVLHGEKRQGSSFA